MKKKRNKRDDTAERCVVPIIKEEKPKKNRALLIAISSFLALVLVFGAVLITVTAVRNARYVASYRGYGMDKETASYFASAYKTTFLKDSGGRDTPEFWASTPEGASKTYGEYLKDGYEAFVKDILVANSLFSSVASMSEEDERKVADAVAYLFDGAEIRGDINKFNESVAKYGFDYDAFVDAAELYYRATRARSAIYGSAGELVSAAGLTEYFNTYSHVKMIFVKDSDILAGKDGIAEKTTALREAIKIFDDTDGKGAGSVTEGMFDGCMKYNSVTLGADGEYYFHLSSEFTVKMGNSDEDGFMHDVVERALTMPVGSYAEVEYGNGSCFIYKYAPDVADYSYPDFEHMFTDLYSDAASYLYGQALAKAAPDVKIKDAFYSIDIIAIPENAYYRAFK